MTCFQKNRQRKDHCRNIIHLTLLENPGKQSLPSLACNTVKIEVAMDYNPSGLVLQTTCMHHTCNKQHQACQNVYNKDFHLHVKKHGIIIQMT